VPDGVLIRTAEGAPRFDRVVIAPGPWANELLNLPAAPVSPVQKTLYWRRPASNEFNLERGFPSFAIETDDDRLFYGFPGIDEAGVKIAEHTGGVPIATPEDRDETPASNEALDLEAFLAATLPALAGRPGHFQRCLYEMSADGHFLVDRHPDSDRVIFAAGLSGHGFKFAPVLGEALASMALDDCTPAGFEFLSLDPRVRCRDFSRAKHT
ncbi:MAG: FAD-dependent oxidoreductase, partial [Gammaproteobacteria bacterium]